MKRGTPRHPKVSHLCELLRVKTPAALGHLELLFHFTSEFAPQGDIGKFEDARIAAALCWPGRPGDLVAALLQSRWIDHHPEVRLVVHDWHDHCDDAVRKRLNRAGLPFLSFAAKVTGHRQTSADIGSLPLPLPLPEPSLARAKPAPTHTLRARPTSASDTGRPASPHFDEWWARWVEGTGRRVNHEAACQAWLSVVRAGDEEAVKACTESYLASDEVSRSVVANPDTWLFSQARERWENRWNPPKQIAERKQAWN